MGSGNIAAVMAGNGGSGGITLIELLPIGGSPLFISDQRITAPSYLISNPAVPYLPWLTSAAEFDEYRSQQTGTGRFSLQNLSGDTVMRDLSRLHSMTELTGALAYCCIWDVAAECAIYEFLGKLAEPVDNGDTFDCSLTSFDNPSAIKAPRDTIGVSCPLDFGSIACGSSSSTPCEQSYGTCSAIERFKGAIIQWNGATLSYVQTSQPAQTVMMNNQRPF